MGQKTSIEWTNHTFNPWWGCMKVSQGCKHCYAESWAKRYGHDIWGIEKNRRTFSRQHWSQPKRWHNSAIKNNERKRVFCASMADVFEDNPYVDSEREKLWQVIDDTEMLDWLLLTKRPQNMTSFVPWTSKWPNNVWAMTSVEDQEQADERIPLLLDVPAKIRGLSVEPLLGPLDLQPWLNNLHWVIVGGESGGGSRPMHPDWVRSLRDQCQEHNVSFFFKQWGNWIPSEDDVKAKKVQFTPGKDGSQDCLMRRVSKKMAGRIIDNQQWDEVPHYSLE
ncbi:MAG: phage Gp37/Gp68 family protein [Chloroflexota bacterium]